MSLAARYNHCLDVFGYDADGGDEPLIHSPQDEAPANSDDHLVARGDSLLDDGEEACIKSPLPGVSDECWTQFVKAMAVANCDAVSDSNSLGMFEMTVRRLDDLGVVKHIKRGKRAGKTVWLAIFVAPLTCTGFLRSPEIQRKVFGLSMLDYANKIDKGEIKKDAEMPLSGALAILHRCGPSGLKTWASGDRFAATQASFDRVSGLF